MRAARKAQIRRLTLEAYQIEGKVARGILHRAPEDGRWMVGDTSLDEWLAQNEGQDITAILIPTESDRQLETRVCRTCGREYSDTSCPYCREVRLRLRGH